MKFQITIECNDPEVIAFILALATIYTEEPIQFDAETPNFMHKNLPGALGFLRDRLSDFWIGDDYTVIGSDGEPFDDDTIELIKRFLR